MDLSFLSLPSAASASVQSTRDAGFRVEDSAEMPSEAPFLLFRLGQSLFGVPALAVREILALPTLSSLSETAPWIPGVLNLRGSIVPVMDLSARFEQPSAPYRVEDSLIVVEWDGAPLALLVSEVCAVNQISLAQIEAPPTHGRGAAPAPFVAGVLGLPEGMVPSGIVMLLHLPHLLNWAGEFGRSTPKVRFDTQPWTPAERDLLQERAVQLLGGAAGSNGENAPRSQNSEQHAPVAVVFLGGEEFGIELSKVREFTSVNAVTKVPCCPPHILGQINLRGDIVTLLDARPALRTAQTSRPYFEARGGGESVSQPVVVVSHPDGAVGIVIDDVRDVLYLSEVVSKGENRGRDAVLSAPETGFFAGSAPYQGRLLPLLDVARLLEEGGLEVEEQA